MIVYGAALSPYVRKVLLFAAEKGLQIEHDPLMGPPSEDFKKASPFGKIPALKDGDFYISDSTAIIAYMDKVKPQPELIPTEAKAHARAIWFEEYADTLLCAATTPIFFHRVVAPLLGRPQDLEVAARAEAEQLPPMLDYLERVAPESGWLLGDQFTLADICVGSVLCNLEHLNLAPTKAARPKTAAYAERVFARPSFAQALAGEKAFLGKAA